MGKINLKISEVVANLKSSKERKECCEKHGQVYLGEGYSISKEDYDRVILYYEKVKYGEDPYRKENT